MDSKTKANRQTHTRHAQCFACGNSNANGLKLEFRDTSDGRVTARCVVDEQYQGYAGVAQGGIIATILDSAMTNCLFCQGVEAVTVRLNVKYREPVLVGQNIIVEAALIHHRGRVYDLEASLTQGDHLKASASGKFMVAQDAV